MNNWRGSIFTAAFCILAIGLIWLVSSPPRGKSIKLLPPPTVVPYKVHVTGEVNIPGVYDLPVGNRVEDAIRAAGGFTDDADERVINLALPLEDGIQILVPSRTKPPNDETPSNENDEQNGKRFMPVLGELIDINTASQEELETLPGIGPVTALAIISYREVEGVFNIIEEIQKVDGIGPAKFDSIKDFITVNYP